ncbi:hypothetical protein [Asanoa siamensis]|uniref:hypothetical protein n=1 Tax=Asanoa siamensis TaxID=926357 RepID=UPI001944F55E|nr:hypothetical protein [Asanoa siamensis]
MSAGPSDGSGPRTYASRAAEDDGDRGEAGRTYASRAAAAGGDGAEAGVDGVKLEEGQRSSLRPSATGTPTYEGMGIEDTAVLPKIGDALQTQRIWTTRVEPDEDEREPEDESKKKSGKKISVTALTDVGIKLLPELEPGAPEGPVTNARWAALVRSAARRLIWCLPAAGVVAAAASIGAMVGGGPAHYLSGASPFRLFAWVTSVWLGMTAMVCLVGVMAAVRSRGTALLGLLLGILGGVSMLMFAAVPPATPMWGLSAKTLALSCAGIYSAGWMAMGWAVFRSRMFTRGDGLMLVLAGPMIGIAGLWMSPFHTAGALLLSAAGLGIAWKSGSTLRAVRAGRAEPPAPPLELAEIRPRRRDKPPKAPKPSKRAKRAKARADAKAAKTRNSATTAGARRDGAGGDGAGKGTAGKVGPGADGSACDGAGRTGAGAEGARGGAGKGRSGAGLGEPARDGDRRDGHVPSRAAGDGPTGRSPWADPNSVAVDANPTTPSLRSATPDPKDSRDSKRTDGKTKPERTGWFGRRSSKAPKTPTASDHPTATKPHQDQKTAHTAKDENPPTASRRPGKRRLRHGAETRETNPPSSDRDRKR